MSAKSMHRVIKVRDYTYLHVRFSLLSNIVNTDFGASVAHEESVDRKQVVSEDPPVSNDNTYMYM